ncbi:unnamed protein product [Coffea canephora]|uniref:Ubiquitin-like domain-containing protein n=2 Tax=Coffea TaxID=13442 RepID=A0A068UZ52_COFCA|nr:unnamed protein product [Coffea canephora]
MPMFEQPEEGNDSPIISFQRSGSLSCPIPYLITDSRSRKSFSYSKIPQKPLKLTVIKLDDSSFDIEVAKTATVAQLKQAVESVFSHLPNRGPKKISWPFVWGHFCLTYDGQKLLTDTDAIGIYGIKDGDKLQFVRHLSISYNMVKERPKKEDPDLDEPSVSEDFKDRQLYSEQDISCNERDLEDQEGVYGDDDKDSGLFTNCRYKLLHLFKGWFSYRKLPSSYVRVEENGVVSRLSFSSLGSFGDSGAYIDEYDSEHETQKAQ